MKRLPARISVVLAVALAQVLAQTPAQRLRMEAGNLYREGRHRDILLRVSPNLAESPDCADLWVMAAEANLKLDEPARAVEQFEKAIHLQPTIRSLCLNLGYAYTKVGRLDDARKTFQSFVGGNTPDRMARAHVGLGLISLEESDTASARASFEAAIKLGSDDQRPYFRLAQLQLTEGDALAAIANFEAALKRDPLQHGAAYGLARAHARAGHAAEAATWESRHRRILAASDGIHSAIEALSRAPDPAVARLAIARLYLSVSAETEAANWLRRGFEAAGDARDVRAALLSAGFTGSDSSLAASALRKFQDRLKAEPRTLRGLDVLTKMTESRPTPAESRP